MPTAVVRFSVLPVSGRRDARVGVEVLDRAAAGDRVEMALVRADGTRESFTVPPGLATLIRDVLEKAAGSERMAVLQEDAELSPEQAGRLLGISRPLVVRRMDDGRLPFRYVGTHRRARLSDVLRVREQERAPREALDLLAADTEDLMADHGL
jgi:excisionase family DNA binding protein